MKRNDSYLSDFGFKKGFKNTLKTYFRISVKLPILLFWKAFLWLFNPKKSVVRAFKTAIIFPILEFFTGKNTSEIVLNDYTYFHHAILKKEVFKDENLKINFSGHKAILLNAKIANIVSIFVLALIYISAIELISAISVLFLGLGFFTFGLTAPVGFLFSFIQILFSVNLFALEISMIRSLFVTDKVEIKDYIDEIILYASLKNEEIYGIEHAEKVKEALYDAYLTEKESVNIVPVDFLDKYLEFKQIPQLTQKSE